MIEIALGQFDLGTAMLLVGLSVVISVVTAGIKASVGIPLESNTILGVIGFGVWTALAFTVVGASLATYLAALLAPAAIVIGLYVVVAVLGIGVAALA